MKKDDMREQLNKEVEQFLRSGKRSRSYRPHRRRQRSPAECSGGRSEDPEPENEDEDYG